MFVYLFSPIDIMLIPEQFNTELSTLYEMLHSNDATLTNIDNKFCEWYQQGQMSAEWK